MAKGPIMWKSQKLDCEPEIAEKLGITIDRKSNRRLQKPWMLVWTNWWHYEYKDCNISLLE